VAGSVPARATAGPATETLRPIVDHVLRVLADETLKGPAHTQERRHALRTIMQGVIDFPQAAQRALAFHWQARTESERAEFVALFKDLATYSYIVTMETYAGQTVVFSGETEHEGVATVVMKIQARQGPPVLIEYRMHQREGRWLVYDVVVEGMSLVGNFRAQFNTIVRTSSYTELIRRMRARVAELMAPSVTTSADRALHRAAMSAVLRRE
jgi:phospholipid transport system substrate-binding protein